MAFLQKLLQLPIAVKALIVFVILGGVVGICLGVILPRNARKNDGVVSVTITVPWLL